MTTDEISPSQYEIEWEKPIDPAEYGVTKWRSWNNGRGQVVVPLPVDADQELIDKLDNVLNSQGVERQCHGEARTLKYWTSTSNPSSVKLELAAKTIRQWRLLKEGKLKL